MNPDFNAYYTHQEYLTAELNKLDYTKPVKVLEFGTGDGSSSIFQSFANRYFNLMIISYESDYGWFINMSKKYPANNYHFHQITSWDELNGFVGNFDLAFVDAGPDFAARIKIIDSIKNYVKVIILHDYDFYNKGVIEDIFSVKKGSFFEKYLNEFTLKGHHEILPPTLIMTKR
jgi:hypothetical protein